MTRHGQTVEKTLLHIPTTVKFKVLQIYKYYTCKAANLRANDQKYCTYVTINLHAQSSRIPHGGINQKYRHA